jgi:hypothetical protein
MSRRRAEAAYFVTWKCPGVRGQRHRVAGAFGLVETVCRRLKRHGVEHRWGVISATREKR